MIMSLAEILFLIFGWVFAVKGLVITSFIISAFWLIVIIVLISLGGKETPKSKLVMTIDFICIVLSIVCLYIRF